MKTVRVALPTKQWGSVNTKYRPSSIGVTDDEFTSGSKNFETNVAGVITKSLGGVLYNQTPLTAAPKDQYEAVFDDGTRHLLAVEGGRINYSSGGGTFTQAATGYSAIANFSFATFKNRVYGGNGISGIVYDRTTSYGGVTYTAPAVKAIGCQVPATAPTAGVLTTGSVPDGSYYYKVTYLYYGEEESNGSAASSVVTVSGGPKGVPLTIPVGGYGVTHREIYRSDDGVVYRWVGEVADNTATTFTDTLASGDEQMPTDNGIPPAFSLIVNHKSRNWMAASDSTLRYTEAGFPDIVCSDNFVTCNPSDPISAIVVFYDRLIVFNRRSMGQIVGETPDTFAYQQLPGSVGCVDDRSIQVRTINGVPELIWLYNRGIYAYNGATISYLSDKIEDLVNFNIQQAQQVKGSVTHSTQSDFQGGTASGGIDLTTTPGTVTTKNPKEVWQTQANWETASATAACRTSGTSNTLQCPTVFTPAWAGGTHNSTVVSGGSLTLTAHSDFTGTTWTEDGSSKTQLRVSGPTYVGSVAQKIALTRAGTLTGLSLKLAGATSGTDGARVILRVWGDTFNSPGTLLASVDAGAADNTLKTYTGAFSLSLAAGTYWLGASSTLNAAHISTISQASSSGSVKGTTNDDGAGTWGTVTYSGAFTPVPYGLAGSYTFVQTAVSSGGNWVSATNDSGLFGDSNALTVNVAHTGTYPAGTSATTYVEQSASDTFSSPETLTAASLNGNANLAFTATKRYWRVRVGLATNDDRNVPAVGTVTLKYPTTTVWTSAEVDCTADVSAYVAATAVTTVPAGTSLTVEAASATTSGGSYSAWAALGSTPLRRYIKFRATLTANAGDTTSPTLTRLTFTYTITANLVSSAIDCATTPSGWDVFQASGAANGGTLTYYVRSAASSGGLTGESFVAAVPGEFPTVTAQRYVQWKAVLVANADLVPTVESVTVNWFIAQINSIRAASLFWNKTYFLAAAESGETTNNIVIILDWLGNWRIRRGVDIATLGLFFGDPYYGSADAGSFVKWQTGNTEFNGASIALDVRTKAFDLTNLTRRKLLRKLFAVVGNTGATWTFDYSLDGGTTFKPLYSATGATSVTTADDDGVSTYRFVPAAADLTGAKTILIRARSEDANAAELHELHMEVIVREGEIING